MPRGPLDRDQADAGRLLWLALVVWILLLVLILTGCATYETLLEAPEDFWLTGEAILAALWQDFTKILGLLLPL